MLSPSANTLPRTCLTMYHTYLLIKSDNTEKSEQFYKCGVKTMNKIQDRCKHSRHPTIRFKTKATKHT